MHTEKNRWSLFLALWLLFFPSLYLLQGSGYYDIIHIITDSIYIFGLSGLFAIACTAVVENWMRR